jgi:hypothetical protein
MAGRPVLTMRAFRFAALWCRIWPLPLYLSIAATIYSSPPGE